MMNIRFYPNHPDNMHCSQAVFRSLFHYFFNEDLSWEQIDKITKTIPGKGSWTMAAEIELSKRGIEVVNIEPFDYERFYEEGIEYLHGHFNTETVRFYQERSNLFSVKDDIPEFLRLVKHETRRATIQDIETMLQQGYLVGAEINSRILNNKPGFALHYVLIQAHTDTSFSINDPGGGSAPPMENRLVSKKDLERALGEDGANSEVTGFRMKIKT
jgi:hypothetical protein